MLAGLGVFGAALFFGDSMITPAISVLSAVEGTETISSSMETSWSRSRRDHRRPVLIQRRGTGSLARLFGPIMLVLFATIERIR